MILMPQKQIITFELQWHDSYELIILTEHLTESCCSDEKKNVRAVNFPCGQSNLDSEMSLFTL